MRARDLRQNIPALRLNALFLDQLELYYTPSNYYPASSDFCRPDAPLRWERNHCEQPFAFPSSMRVHVMTRQQRELQQNNRFNKQNNNFARVSLFHFGISLPFFYDYDVKMPSFAFYG